MEHRRELCRAWMPVPARLVAPPRLRDEEPRAPHILADQDEHLNHQPSDRRPHPAGRLEKQEVVWILEEVWSVARRTQREIEPRESHPDNRPRGDAHGACPLVVHDLRHPERKEQRDEQERKQPRQDHRQEKRRHRHRREHRNTRRVAYRIDHRLTQPRPAPCAVVRRKRTNGGVLTKHKHDQRVFVHGKQDPRKERNRVLGKHTHLP